jgi:hypothetical protein
MIKADRKGKASGLGLKWDDKSRQERESFWIRKLKTLSPNGINEKK